MREREVILEGGGIAEQALPEDTLKIHTDLLDLRVKQRGTQIDKVTGAIVAGGSGFASFTGLVAEEIIKENASHIPTLIQDIPFGSLTTPASLLCLGATMTVADYRFFEWLRDKTIAKCISETVDSDPDGLGYSATQLVYSGDKEIAIAGDTLVKGDNFLFVLLPALQSKDAIADTAVQSKLYYDLCGVTAKDLQEKVKKREVKAVVFGNIDYDPNIPFRKYNNPRPDTIGNIFSGKDITLIDSQHPVYIFSTEQFENIVMDPQELFAKAVEVIDDKPFTALMEMAKRAGTAEEGKMARNLLLRRASVILEHELQAKANGSEFKRYVTDGYAFQKKRLQSSLHVHKRRDDSLGVLKISDEGDVQPLDLQRLLPHRRKTLDEILSSTSTHKRAEVTAQIYDMLRTVDLADLLTEKVHTRDEVLADLAEGQITLTVDTTDVDQYIDKEKTTKLHQKKFKRLIPLFIAGTFAAAFPSVSTAIMHPDVLTGFIPQPISGSLLKPYFRTFTSETGYPIGVPKHRLDWKITTSGKMSAEGYYTTETSHQIDGKTWQINTRREENWKPEPTFHPKDALILEKKLELTPFGETSIKIPRKDDSLMFDLTVIGEDITSDDYKVYVLSDNTYEVFIRHTGKKTNSVYITASFVGSRQNVYATEPIVPLDPGKINEVAKAYVAQSEIDLPDYYDNGDFIAALAEHVQENHFYSINPPGKNEVQTATTAEELVNAVVHSSGCDCDTCNATLVLLSTFSQNNLSFSNIAFGYLNDIQGNPSSGTGGYLRNEALHAYGITSEGDIVDSTPSKLGDDKETKAYMKRLQNLKNYDKEWDDDIQKEERMRQLKRNLAILMDIGLAGAGIGIARKVLQSMEKKDGIPVRDKIISHMLTRNDLIKIYSFYNWLSWGGSTEMHQYTEIPQRNQLFNHIRQNMNNERFAEYMEDPAKFDKELDIEDRDLMRFIALDIL